MSFQLFFIPEPHWMDLMLLQAAYKDIKGHLLNDLLNWITVTVQ